MADLSQPRPKIFDPDPSVDFKRSQNFKNYPETVLKEFENRSYFLLFLP